MGKYSKCIAKGRTLSQPVEKLSNGDPMDETLELARNNDLTRSEQEGSVGGF